MKLENVHRIPAPVAIPTLATLTVVVFFSNLVAMPGPSSLYHLAFSAHKYMLFASLTLPIILIPFAALWFFVQACRSVRVYWPMWWALLVQAILLINVLLIQTSLQTIARQRIVEEGKVVVQALEDYHSIYGNYPDDLAGLAPNFVDHPPSPSIIGIKSYHYSRTESGYNLSFYEDFAPFLDYYMVTYLPSGPPDRDEAAWSSLDTTGWWIVYVD
jgi:hypothetical protein